VVEKNGVKRPREVVHTITAAQCCMEGKRYSQEKGEEEQDVKHKTVDTKNSLIFWLLLLQL